MTRLPAGILFFGCNCMGGGFYFSNFWDLHGLPYMGSHISILDSVYQFPTVAGKHLRGVKRPVLRCYRPLTAAGGAVQAHEHPRGGGAGGSAVGALGAAVGTAAGPAQQVGCAYLTLNGPCEGCPCVRTL